MDIQSLMKELHFMQQSYATLFSVTNKVQAQGDEKLDILTSRQHMTLIAIAHMSLENATLMNIARKLDTTKQTANKSVTSLEKKGYVRIEPSKTDKRSINVVITNEGKQALVTSSEKTTLFLEEIFHEFTTDEIETFWNLLQKLYRFDGKTQDGFEEKATLEFKEQLQSDLDSYQEKVLTEFSKRRYGGANNE
ncbi:MarR family winged helix-turn-helix transcriptional regulator [Oceanobacillus neutriphilus]|uniref:MarR family transcriptional regulator n=1 Tax=Oceanobacillus neutriphilus TaxID=531815 RepID=A0ABQ2P2Z4_9BACI|nr:MarR family transcriptional regulator [Oceanobacillus neutriphilus]GGP16929.1 MarR family transcriptional regulator [Oceanobacillus neutriphilus]